MPGSRRQCSTHPTHRLLGTSLPMVALRRQIQQLVRFDTPGNPAVPTLLLQGETGTGKSLVAQVVHDSGPRAAGPFVAVNCATLPETMLEAELFGFEAGSFTDAKRAKPGLFEAAVGGTLFLDEIDTIPLTLQGKLLTALESKRVRRLGAVTDRHVDVKLIAATNADLGQAVAAGRLRGDVYHRLAVVVLTLPPLRERGDDILTLAQAHLTQLAQRHHLTPKRLLADAVQWLHAYTWPGNVRELEHLLERVMLLHEAETVDAATLTHWCQALPEALQTPPLPAPDTLTAPQEHVPLSPVAVLSEAQQLQEALARAGGNVSQAARLLGWSRDQVRTRMRRYQLARPTLPPRTRPSVARTSGSSAASNLPASTALPAAPNLGGEAPPEPARLAAPATLTLCAAIAPPPAVPEAERRHLTVLSAQLLDAPVLASQHDPEAWQEMVHDYHARCTTAITREGGYVAQYLGDGVLAYFGYPQAHEDDAQRAVRAGLALVEVVQALPSLGDVPPLRVRLGMHTGLVVISAVGTDGHHAPLALGDTPMWRRAWRVWRRRGASCAVRRPPGW